MIIGKPCTIRDFFNTFRSDSSRKLFLAINVAEFFQKLTSANVTAILNHEATLLGEDDVVNYQATKFHIQDLLFTDINFLTQFLRHNNTQFLMVTTIGEPAIKIQDNHSLFAASYKGPDYLPRRLPYGHMPFPPFQNEFFSRTGFGAPNWPEFKSPWTPGTFVCPRSGLISNILELVDSDAARASKYISFESTDTEVDFDAIDPSQILNLQFDIGYSAADLDRILIYSATDLERIFIEGEPLTVESFRMLLKLAAADGMTHLRTDRIYSQPEEPTSVILHPNVRIDNALRQLSNKDDSTAVKFKGESSSVIGGSTFTIAEVKSDDSGSSINGIPLTAGVLRILLQNAHINGYAHAAFKFMR